MSSKPQFSENALTVLCKRYLAKKDDNAECERCGGKHETPLEMLQRISMNNQAYYDLFTALDFLPNSPTIFNMGLNDVVLAACFKFDVQDSMESIMDVATKSAFVQKWGGGVGYVLSALRGKGETIKSTQGKACGPISVMQHYHSVAEMITQGGKREGAQMAVLHCEHPDIREFVHCKDDDSGSLSTFNLSVAVTDEFMSEADEHPSSDAGLLLDEIVASAHRKGDPGLYFISTAERGNPTPWLGALSGTNPCGETPLLDNEACNLGSINLTNFVLRPGTGDSEFDFARLCKVTHIAIRYLDDVLDRCIFSDEVIKEATLKTRKLGLGIMGWADVLALMHIAYDSDGAIDLAREVMHNIRSSAVQESENLARMRGGYPGLSDEPNPRQIQQRHATLTGIAPTGSISVLADVSPGIEPHFALETVNIMGDGTQLRSVLPVLERINGFVPHTAHEIGWAWHVRHQAAFQEHVDLAISKTVNLPQDATIEDVRDTFMMMWQTGCKGGTVYRDGSHENQPLRRSDKMMNDSIPEASPTHYHGRKRLPTTRNAVIHHFRVGDTEGYIHFGMYENGDLGELFITVSKPGSTMQGLLDTVAILTSMALQHGVPLESLVEKMRDRRFDPMGLTENPSIPNVSSILDYTFRLAHARFLSPSSKPSSGGQLCPECGQLVIRQEGCERCSGSCGWSKC